MSQTPASQWDVAIDARLVGRAATGDSTYWLGLLYGLSQIETGLRFLLLSNAEPPPKIPESDSFRWVTVPSRNQRLWSLLRFPLAARKLGARAIHTQYNLSPLAGRAGITTIHDVSFFIGPQWFRLKDRVLLQRGVYSAANRAARVITVSETSRSEIERYIPPAKGKVAAIPLARNPLIVALPKEEAESEARSMGLDGPYVMTVGTRWPRKNMDLAVHAVEALPQDLPHRLALTGKAGWGAAADGTRVHAVGYVSERQLSALYTAATLHLLPSRHEGFGITMLEAFACGCPVACSAGGALPEVAGDAAEIVRSWRPEDWSRAIADLLRNPSKLQDLRQRGLEREKQFTWRRTAEKTVEVYKDVIHHRS